MSSSVYGAARQPRKGESLDKDFLEILEHLKMPTERDKQRLVGASQIGGCAYHLGLSMLQSHGLEEVEPSEPGLGAWIGTGVHAYIENNLQLTGAVQECDVDIFDIPGYGNIRGHIDMYWHNRVFDWKVLGKASFQKMQLGYRKQPDQIPSTVYRVQQHLYADGLIQQGYEVEDVNIVAIPKHSNRFSDIAIFTEVYNQGLVDKAIERAREIWLYASDGRLKDLPRDLESCYTCSSAVTIKRK